MEPVGFDLSYINYVIGFDPGVTGGFCVLKSSGELVKADNYPVLEFEVKNHRKPRKRKNGEMSVVKPTRIEKTIDTISLADGFRWYGNDPRKPPNTIAFLEKVNSRPGESPIAAFKFGDMFGQMKMLCAALRIPMVEVPPATWCAYVHDQRLVKMDIDPKKRSRAAFERVFHEYALAHDKISDGVVDAGMIAHFGVHKVKVWKEIQ